MNRRVPGPWESFLCFEKKGAICRQVCNLYVFLSVVSGVTKSRFFVMSFLKTSTALGRHASPLGNSVRSRLTWCPRRSRLRSGPKPLGIKINISLFLWIIETTPNCVGSRRVVKVTDQLTEIPQRTRRTLRRHLPTESPAAHHFHGKRCARRGATNRRRCRGPQEVASTEASASRSSSRCPHLRRQERSESGGSHANPMSEGSPRERATELQRAQEQKA